MKSLLINTLPLLARQTGVGRHIREVCLHWPKDSGLDLFYYYGRYTRRFRPGKSSSGIYTDDVKRSLHRSPFIRRQLKNALKLYGWLNPRRFDVYWEPNFIPLDYVKRRRVALTIHDVSFHDHPEWHPADRIEYYKRDFYPRLQACDLLLTVSEFCKARIAAALGYPADRIKVIPHGVDPATFHPWPKQAAAPLLKRLGIKGPFFLFVGSLEPRKNVDTLIHAHLLLDKKTQRQYPLLLVGPEGWRNEDTLDLIGHNRETILRAGFVSDQDLAALYGSSLALVYPSLYEGFGLPPLEAMACGTPAIVSDIPPHHEACASAAIFVDPSNVEALSQAMLRVIDDAAFREACILKGKEQAAAFTWSRTATEHARIFCDLCAR